MTAMWGIHGDVTGANFVRDGVIVLERPHVGDLRLRGEDREVLKRALARSYPNAKPATIAAWAGVLLRFAFEAAPGDVVIHPHKLSRTLSFGWLEGEYYWDASSQPDRHSRRVRWVQSRVPRDRFSDAARQELSARQAFFAVGKNIGEFEAFLAEQS